VPQLKRLTTTVPSIFSGRLTLKYLAQRWLTRIGLYDRLKASVIYDAYWLIWNPSIIRERSREVDFYRATLAGFCKGDLIFDIGANEGYKTDIFLRLGARVVAVDPDHLNQERLRRKFLMFRRVPAPVRIVGEAVSASSGVLRMWVDEPGSAKNTLSAKWVDTLRTDNGRFGKSLNFTTAKEVSTTTLEALIQTHGQPFYIKIDVEGHEPDVLRGLRQPVRYLSFEVNLPEFAAEGCECIRLLTKIAPTGEFNFARPTDAELAMKRWVSGEELLRDFSNIGDSSVEVYWRTTPLDSDKREFE